MRQKKTPSVTIDGKEIGGQAVSELRLLVSKERKWVKTRLVTLSYLERLLSGDPTDEGNDEWMDEADRRLAASEPK